MGNSTNAGPRPALRVLLAGGTPGSSAAITTWLGDQGGFEVTGPAATIADTLVVASRFRPDVVLLDFHGLSVSVGHAIALFKALAPTPQVFVLSHELSDTLLQRCGALRADAVFHKTEELDQLAASLDRAASRSSDLHPAPIATSTVSTATSEAISSDRATRRQGAGGRQDQRRGDAQFRTPPSTGEPT